MKTLLAAFLGFVFAGTLIARDASNRITPQIQAELDAQKRVIAQWAANPTVISAVKAQNAKGPIPGMTNGKWKALDASDPLIQSFQKDPAGTWLAKKVAASNGLFREAFLNAAAGEKVAFVQKPSSYLHTGDPKFSVPMSGRFWVGKPEWDKSSNSYSIQLAAPVISKGKPIGALVVGVSMKLLKTQPTP